MLRTEINKGRSSDLDRVYMKGNPVSPSEGHREYCSPIRPRALANLSHTGQHSPSGTEKCSHPLSSSQRMSSHTTLPLSHTHSRHGSGFQMALGSWVTSPSLQPGWFSGTAEGREVMSCLKKKRLPKSLREAFLTFTKHSLTSYTGILKHNMQLDENKLQD